MEINEIDITNRLFSQNPFEYYERLREVGPVHFLEKNNAWLVIGFEEITEVLNQPKVYTSEGQFSFDPILLNCDPPKHTQNRKILASDQALFSSNRISKIEEKNREIANQLIAEIRLKSDFDLLKDFALPFSSLVILDLLGLKVEDNQALRVWSQFAVSNESIHDREFAEQQWETLKPIVEQWIEDGKMNPEKPGINEFIFHPHAADYFSKEDIVNLTKVLLLGGNETTPNLVSSAFLLLFKHPELLEKIKTDSNLIPAVINETLRLEAPTQIIQRTSLVETKLGGVTIPKNSLVSLAIGAGNRDPKVFENPNIFDVFRPKSKILSFGFGPHYCLGAHLARQEAEIALELIIKEFPDLNISWNQEFVYRNSSHVRGLNSLIINTKLSKVNSIEQVRKKAIELIKASQLPSGEFQTFEYYPNNEELKEQGWHYTKPSPFVHANVIYSLGNVIDKEAFRLNTLSGIDFIVSRKEKGDVWRFWEIQPGINNVPADVDDTAICSAVIARNGLEVENKELFYRNINKDGSLKTWLLPNFSLFFTHPNLFLEWSKQKNFYKPTLQSGMFNETDVELGVMSNALVYLGENERTQKTIDFCLDTWFEKSDQQHFYSNKIVTAFHISRAFKEGVSKFKRLQQSIETLISNNFETLNFAEFVLSGLTLKYFENEDDLYLRLKSRILSICKEEEFSFPNFEYFTSKDRNYVAGSPVLVSAWFFELSEKWND
jgi:cytochrome P450